MGGNEGEDDDDCDDDDDGGGNDVNGEDGREHADAEHNPTGQQQVEEAPTEHRPERGAWRGGPVVGRASAVHHLCMPASPACSNTPRLAPTAPAATSAQEGNKIFLALEYCEGGDIATLIKNSKKEKQNIPEEIIWSVLSQMIAALGACHNRKEGKILHRDLKPGNIFLD